MSFPSFTTGLYQRLLFILPFATDYFNYDDPNQWYKDFPTCEGYKQSPIAISAHKTIVVNLPPILFRFYDVPFAEPPTLQNNGHTIEFDVPETVLGERPYITGGLLEDIFETQAVHFHWGSPQQKGSEHKINGRRYDLEMHIVHKNVKYESVEIARNFDDGLAVLAVMFKVVKSPNVLYRSLNDIYDKLEQLASYNSTATLSEPITLGSLLGDIRGEEYFTYKGSLTTPPCSEAVTWFVFPEVVAISYTELPKFWILKDSRNQPLLNNFRPLQPLTYRKVYYSKPSDFNYYL